MSNKQLRTYILLAFAAIFSTSSFAQTRLQFGLEEHSSLVKTPYIHWDLLRTMNPEWIREMRNTPTAPWEPLNRLFNEKDAAGRFTLLQYQVWSFGNNDWADDNKNSYLYTLDANNRVSEIQVSVMNQFYTNSRTEYYEYDAAGNITREAFEINGNIGYEAHFWYDTLGLRIIDSIFSFPGGNMTHMGLRYYEYDANNRCTEQTNVYNINNSGWDTLGVTYYTWQGSNLASIESHSITQLGSPVIPFNRADYTYAGNQVADATISEYDTAAQQFIPMWFYKHYYANNRMTAMVSGESNGVSLENTDSLVLNYLTNGNLDTGYQFAALGNGWETAARFRLLFRKINTGLPLVKPVINAVNVYPNPVADFLSLDIEMAEEGNISLQVTDITGKTIKTINAVNMPVGKNTMKVSAQDMAPGIYFITCGNSSVKVVKE